MMCGRWGRGDKYKKVTPNPRRILHPILLAMANHNLKPRGINTYSEYCSFIDDCPEVGRVIWHGIYASGVWESLHKRRNTKHSIGKTISSRVILKADMPLFPIILIHKKIRHYLAT